MSFLNNKLDIVPPYMYCLLVFNWIKTHYGYFFLMVCKSCVQFNLLTLKKFHIILTDKLSMFQSKTLYFKRLRT